MVQSSENLNEEVIIGNSQWCEWLVEFDEEADLGSSLKNIWNVIKLVSSLGGFQRSMQ